MISNETALTYGQKLIAEAIEAHFGERVENYDEDVDDTSNHDAWEAFDAVTRIARTPADGPEPVAYRWRVKGAELWVYDPTMEWVEASRRLRDDLDIEPLYTHPVPVDGPADAVSEAEVEAAFQCAYSPKTSHLGGRELMRAVLEAARRARK